MDPLATQDLRSNLATWAVPLGDLPAASAALVQALPPEDFDPDFRGQFLQTTYFDTPRFRLRKARQRGDKYLTLRIRCYRPAGDSAEETYALSAKAENAKFRQEIPEELARVLLSQPLDPLHWGLLPADLHARLLEMCQDQPLVSVVTVRAHRYAVEDETDRLTLDVAVTTDTGKALPYSVLEFKSSDSERTPPPAIAGQYRSIKLSKFLWATRV